MSARPDRTPLPRGFFDRPVLTVAPDLLGRTLVRRTDDGPIELRITEVEAYEGESDPGSHAYRGRTARNASMFGPPGHAYVYFIYGMWFSLNLVCGPGAARAECCSARVRSRWVPSWPANADFPPEPTENWPKGRPASPLPWASTAPSTAPTCAPAPTPRCPY